MGESSSAHKKSKLKLKNQVPNKEDISDEAY